MTGAYLDTHAVLLGAVLFGVWTLVALIVGVLIGAVIRQADTHSDDATWLDDQPDGRTDTREIYVPREWFA